MSESKTATSDRADSAVVAALATDDLPHVDDVARQLRTNPRAAVRAIHDVEVHVAKTRRVLAVDLDLPVALRALGGNHDNLIGRHR